MQCTDRCCRISVIASWKHLTRALLPRALQHCPRVQSMSAVGCVLLLSWSIVLSASRACHKQQADQMHEDDSEMTGAVVGTDETPKHTWCVVQPVSHRPSYQTGNAVDQDDGAVNKDLPTLPLVRSRRVNFSF